MTTLINGKETGQKIQQQIKLEVNALNKKGIEPCLAVILVGDDPASQVYVRNKKRTCGELGILSLEHKLPSQTSQDDLEGLVKKLNEDSSALYCGMPLEVTFRRLDEDISLPVFRPAGKTKPE